MKKRIARRARLLRPTDGLLPLVFILVSALGRSSVAERVYLSTLFPALFALASARGLRIAFSEQPSMRKVAGSVRLALALQFIGALAFLVIDLIRNRGQFILSNALFIAVGMLLNIEHVFYEYLFATGDDASAVRVRFITAALAAAGIMMTSPASGDGALPYALEWLLGGAALAAFVSAVIGRGVGGRLKGRVNNRVLRVAPPAIAQSAVYPLVWLVAMWLLRPVMFDALTAVPFFAGLLVYEMSRAPFRRDGRESKGFNIAMLIVALVGVGLASIHYVPAAQIFLFNYIGKWSHEVPATGVMLAAAAMCSFGMYGGIGSSK